MAPALPKAPRSASRWTALRAGVSALALIALFLWLGVHARLLDAAADPNPRLIQLTRADFAMDPPGPPGAAPPRHGWQPVALPDNWRLRMPGQGGIGWYRLHVALDAPPAQPLALYLPRLALTGRLFLNGSLLNPGREFSADGPTHRPAQNEMPTYLVLPSGLFRAGDNLLDIQLQADARVHSGLSSATLGPAELLHGRWLLRYLVQVMASYVAMVLVAGTLCALLAYTRRRRFSLMPYVLLTAVATLAAFLVPGLPLSAGGQQVLRIAVSMAMFWLLCVAGYRYAGVRLRWFLPVLHTVSVATIATVVALVVVAPDRATDQLWLLTWPHIALRGLVVAFLLHRAWTERSAKFFALGTAAALWVAALVQANLLMHDLIPWDSLRWSIAGVLPFTMVLLYAFAERFILDREDSARAQRDAIAAERGRILQDMHDGMGAQLVTALRLARAPAGDRHELARAIEESLQDLRLIIDSLDFTEQDDLLPLLGNLRFRLEPRLEALGMRLAWDMQPLSELSGLAPQAALSVLRIVQEALNNAVQHAGARCLEVSARRGDDAIVICIADDGRGFDPAARTAGSGRGLAGMRLRAARLGATLAVDSSAQGTVVALALPCPAA